jgi:carboxymethylenebutenolidase
MIFGRQDPHIDRLGRKRIHNALMEADVSFSWHEFNGQHAFMRDEGSAPFPPLLHLLSLSPPPSLCVCV